MNSSNRYFNCWSFYTSVSVVFKWLLRTKRKMEEQDVFNRFYFDIFEMIVLVRIIKKTQFKYNKTGNTQHSVFKGVNKWILQSGYINQYTSAKVSSVAKVQPPFLVFVFHIS